MSRKNTPPIENLRVGCFVVVADVGNEGETVGDDDGDGCGGGADDDCGVEDCD